MPGIKDLKKRIGSVKNTQQTTKAMKMVSAAKLRRAQEAISNHRPYARRIGGMIALLSSLRDPSSEQPLLPRKEGVMEPEKKRLLLVLVTSDRGLCGGFNGNNIKTAQRWIKENEGRYSEIQLAFVGRKGHDFFRGKGNKIVAHYADLSGKVVFAKAKKLADSLLELYTSGEVDEVKFVYSEFKSAISQKVVVEDFLPLPEAGAQEAAGTPTEPVDLTSYLIRPSSEELLGLLLEKNFSIQAFRVLLESQASEHGARMSAMENATRNAGEMIKKLTLLYNKQRQAGITKELLEIIAGSESQKTSA